MWIILTVIIPGLVFYGTFRVLVFVLGIDIPFLIKLDSTESLLIAVLFAIMFIIQMFGIILEDIAFRFWPYKHTKNIARNKGLKYNELQEAFDNKYQIIALMDPNKNVHVERCLAQFFMSHNIAVGMGINLLWITIYEFIVLFRFDTITILTFVVLFVITLASIWVPYTRFHNSSKMLYVCMKELEKEGKTLPCKYSRKDEKKFKSVVKRFFRRNH